MKRIRVLKDSTLSANRILVRDVFGAGNINVRTSVINPELCKQALEKLDLGAYKNSYVIDINPGTGIWSEILHEHLKPKHHVLIEPDTKCLPVLEKLIQRHPNAHLVKLNGHDWTTYYQLLGGPPYQSPPFPKKFPAFKPNIVPVEDGINTDVLFVGNLTRKTEAQRLVSQFLESCAKGEWIQGLGRVRFLLWLHDIDKERLLPKVIQARTRPAVILETVCKATEIVGSGTVRHGKGFSVSQASKQKRKSQYTPETWSKHMDATQVKVKRNQRRTDNWYKKWHSKGIKPVAAEKYKESYKAAVILETTYLKKKMAKCYRVPYDDINGLPWPNADIPTLREMMSKMLAMTLEESLEATVPAGSSDHLLNKSRTIIKSGTYTPTADEAAEFDSFEENYLTSRFRALHSSNSLADEEYAMSLDPPLLQSWRQQRDELSPIVVDDKDVHNNFYPVKPLTLIDFEPIILHPWLRHPDNDTRRRRFELYSWMLRMLFINRARSVRVSLKGICPGGELLLEDFPKEKGKQLGNKSVRVLTINELVELASAWDEWAFKPDDWMMDDPIV